MRARLLDVRSSKSISNGVLQAGLNVEGINAEVMMGQWEYQVFAKGAKEAGDQVWIARYLLERVAEKYGMAINLHCKPVAGDWNGSRHARQLLELAAANLWQQETYEAVCQAFEPRIKHHIDVYGADNEQRLTGLHETQSIDMFSYGVDRPWRLDPIPIATVENGWQGWLEDRRPAFNADPYMVASAIITAASKPSCLPASDRQPRNGEF